MSRYCCGDCNWSLASMLNDCWLPLMLPFGLLTLAPAMAVRMLSMLSPSAASAGPFTVTRMAGLWPPDRLTRPTPDTCESFWLSRVSARSYSVVSGRVDEVSPRVMTGASAGLTLA